ncbi:hypothetical protein ABXT43_01895 [Candidatus Pelagibacter sp. Uisw_114]
MKNKFIAFLFILLFTFINLNRVYSEEFIFEVTDLEITQNGNLIKGINGGSVTADNGILITAENFEYNKLTSLLKANGNV